MPYFGAPEMFPPLPHHVKVPGSDFLGVVNTMRPRKSVREVRKFIREGKKSQLFSSPWRLLPGTLQKPWALVPYRRWGGGKLIYGNEGSRIIINFEFNYNF